MLKKKGIFFVDFDKESVLVCDDFSDNICNCANRLEMF